MQINFDGSLKKYEISLCSTSYYSNQMVNLEDTKSLPLLF